MKFFKLSGRYFMAALMMMIVYSLSLSADAKFLDEDGIFTVGKGNHLSVQKFAEADFAIGEWRKVEFTAHTSKAKVALPDTHFFALVSTNTDNLFILKESKSLVVHNILAVVRFKKNTLIPQTVQNDGDMNIAINVKKSNILEVNYLATTDKILKHINVNNAEVLAIIGKNHNMKFILTNGKGAGKGSNKLVKISFNDNNIIKVETHKHRADAKKMLKLNPNSMVKYEAELNIKNKFGTPNMLKANVANVENNGTAEDSTAFNHDKDKSNIFIVAVVSDGFASGNVTAQILNNLNPYTHNGKIFAKTAKIIKKEFSTPQVLMSADAVKWLNFDATDSGKNFGEHMIHASALQISLDPNNYSKTGQGMINDNLKMKLQTTDVYANNVSFVKMSLIA